MLYELHCSLKSYCDSDLRVLPHLCYGSVLRSPLFTVGSTVMPAFRNSNSVASLYLVMFSSFVCILHNMPSLDGYFHTWTLLVTWQEVLQVLFLFCRLHCLNLACKNHTVQFAIVNPLIISPYYHFILWLWIRVKIALCVKSFMLYTFIWTRWTLKVYKNKFYCCQKRRLKADKVLSQMLWTIEEGTWR